MTIHTIGIILNGATGRICSTQHVANALAPIRDEGGLTVGHDRIVPRLMLAGATRRSSPASPRATAPNGPPTSTRRWPIQPSRVFFDAACNEPEAGRAGKGHRRGQAHLCREAVALSVDQGLALLRAMNARGLKHGAVEDKLGLPGLQKLSRLKASDFFGRVTGFRIEFGWWVFDGTEVACQRPSWNYRKKDGGGLILDMYPHWRYVIENTLGPMRRVVTALTTATLRGSTSAARATTSTSRTMPRPWSSWKTARPARSCRPGRRGCGATICSRSRSTAPKARPSPACTNAGPPPMRRRRAPRISPSPPISTWTIAPTGTR